MKPVTKKTVRSFVLMTADFVFKIENLWVWIYSGDDSEITRSLTAS